MELISRVGGRVKVVLACQEDVCNREDGRNGTRLACDEGGKKGGVVKRREVEVEVMMKMGASLTESTETGAVGGSY
jgi:hypothetical protein